MKVEGGRLKVCQKISLVEYRGRIIEELEFG